MKKLTTFLFTISLFAIAVSCHDNKQVPNYQYFPNMYAPVGLSSNGVSKGFENGLTDQEPVEGTIPRGWEPYEYPNTNEGYELAKQDTISPLAHTEENIKNGAYLYNIYCASCHGKKGNGQGELAKRNKILGIPNYADRDITEGSVYFVEYYGRNLMGSHANQVNDKERWQIAQHVMELRSKLIK